MKKEILESFKKTMKLQERIEAFRELMHEYDWFDDKVREIMENIEPICDSIEYWSISKENPSFIGVTWQWYSKGEYSDFQYTLFDISFLFMNEEEYVPIYKEKKRLEKEKEEEERRIKEEQEKERKRIEKEQMDYKKYLELKDKYENK